MRPLCRHEMLLASRGRDRGGSGVFLCTVNLGSDLMALGWPVEFLS